MNDADIGGGLLAACTAELARLGVASEDVTIVSVPGALEAPLALQQMALTEEFDALIALGAVIRGETAHFEYVAGPCSNEIARIQQQGMNSPLTRPGRLSGRGSAAPSRHRP